MHFTSYLILFLVLSGFGQVIESAEQNGDKQNLSDILKVFDGLANIPTKDDLAALETRLSARFDRLKSDLEALINRASRQEEESRDRENNHARKRRSMQIPDFVAADYRLGILTTEVRKSSFNETCQFVEKIFTVQNEQAAVLEEIRNTTSKIFQKTVSTLNETEVSTPYVFEIPDPRTGRLTKFCGDDLDLAGSTFPKKPLSCDKGWIKIQRRGTPTAGWKERTNFERNFTDYANGFGGHLDGEDFWIGLETIHALTKAGYTQLRVDLEDWEGNKAYAMYNEFKVGGALDKYNLTVGGYNGTAGDSLSRNSGKKFTTFDNDNDEDKVINCASQRRGGWWYWNCSESQLNSMYHTSSREEKPYTGIIWYHWKGHEYSLKKVEMKIRKPSQVI
ncbi:techylectin-5B isoform X2 [Folsomia candida]|uniref:techylectin-5B isoform X2 n=1 Tax=Folsomia candida TaxID=158441 RepID=UPI000B8F81CD|nr:techylectin-5B isoform X2 [Folsomia candida]